MDKENRNRGGDHVNCGQSRSIKHQAALTTQVKLTCFLCYYSYWIVIECLQRFFRMKKQNVYLQLYCQEPADMV